MLIFFSSPPNISFVYSCSCPPSCLPLFFMSIFTLVIAVVVGIFTLASFFAPLCIVVCPLATVFSYSSFRAPIFLFLLLFDFSSIFFAVILFLKPTVFLTIVISTIALSFS